MLLLSSERKGNKYVLDSNIFQTFLKLFFKRSEIIEYAKLIFQDILAKISEINIKLEKDVFEIEDLDNFEK